ncbi:MAG: cyclopropane-fatty-acyl-phospholipid synthase family protein [Myxococcota bacterium]
MNAAALDQLAIHLAESGRIPDRVIRQAIRRMCAQRLREDIPDDPAEAIAQTEAFVEQMRQGPIAPAPQDANEQHYALPTAFFREALGPHLKYSCAYWPTRSTTLAEAEAEALARTAAHAELADGQRILELGCGWGSLTLWMAQRYPQSRVTAVSNSASQRRYIERVAQQRGLTNLEVLTADMNDFATTLPMIPMMGRFDRVVSVEMFEHMRNYERLLDAIAAGLEPDGRVLVHIFCHRHVPYGFATEGASNWMGRHFFSGGIMPSDDLLLRCRSDLRVLRQWRWPGSHYQRTANAWLANVDRRRKQVRSIMRHTYGPAAAPVWQQRWRIFFMACAELFGYQGGRQWWVSHYQLGRCGRPQ